MSPKKAGRFHQFNPLRRPPEFRFVLQNGNAIVGNNLVLYTLKVDKEENKFGIIVSKKVGKAVIRNRFKRILREIYRLNRTKLKPGFLFVVVVRHRARHADFSSLNKEMLNLWQRAGAAQK